jgi:uncharacterized protein
MPLELMILEKIKKEILEKLTETLQIDRVILFGSFASGMSGADSDIDLIVVTEDDFMPQTFEDNIQNYLRVSSALRDIKRRIPIDLIVHTKPMHEKFIKLGSMFSKEVAKRGEVLYEKSH